MFDFNVTGLNIYTREAYEMIKEEEIKGVHMINIDKLFKIILKLIFLLKKKMNINIMANDYRRKFYPRKHQQSEASPRFQDMSEFMCLQNLPINNINNMTFFLKA